MNEDIERKRADITIRALEALTVMMEDKAKQTGERLEAGNLLRGICQDLILSDLSSRGITEDSSFKRNLLRSANKLDQDRHEP